MEGNEVYCSAVVVIAEPLQKLHVWCTFDKVQNFFRLPRTMTSERPKVFRTRQFFTLLRWKCVSCQNGVHSFEISTSKISPTLACFLHLTWTRASRNNSITFRHLNCQQCSQNRAFWHPQDAEHSFGTIVEQRISVSKLNLKKPMCLITFVFAQNKTLRWFHTLHWFQNKVLKLFLAALRFWFCSHM